MYEFVALGHIWWVLLSGKPGQPLFENIYTQGVHARYAHVDAKIKLVAIDEEGIGDVAGHDGKFIDADFSYVVYDVNAAASGHVCWFHDP